MQRMEEQVDEVDEHDNVIRVVARSEMRRRVLLHRSVGILVRNSAGEILIHRRALDKDVYPGAWDLAVGGVVASGEHYLTAAERELSEEVGISGVPLEELGRTTYLGERIRTIVGLYTVTWDGPIHFADGEIDEALWVTLDDLAERLQRDEFIEDSKTLAPPFLY